MNIKDFLIENYIWILVIILITIITIIGFLADKKKNGKKSDAISTTNSNTNEGQPINNVTPIQYNAQDQFMSNQMNNNNNLELNSGNFNNQILQQNQSNDMSNNLNINNENNMGMNNGGPLETISTMPLGVNNTINNSSPIENIVPNPSQESMYQPLSEQKPVIQPRPIPNFNNIQNNNQEMINPIENALNSSNPNYIPQMGPNFNQQNHMQNEPSINPMQGFNNVQPPIPGSMNNNNNINIPNYSQNNNTIPEPVNVVPIPQQVNPQQIMQNTYNNGPLTPSNNYNQSMGQPNLNQQQVPLQQNQSTNQPINFVYGPQSNNQNM